MTGNHRRILVVEDDPETAGQLTEQLANSGYQVDLAATGTEALSRGIATDYAVITIDRMLPDIDGIAVMRQLRDDGVAVPFLIISALGEVDDRVRGLRAGGDDYLVKPFSFMELLARLEALGRRSDTIAKETILRIGDLAVDLISRAASRRGKEIMLLPKEFQLLEYLVRNEGRIVSRAMLLQHVWDLHFDPSTNIIDVYVARLRRKLDEQQAYPLIHTVRGSDIVSVLLAKTLTSSTFKLALIAIGTFGVIVSAIFAYVYLSTASFIRSRSDHAITIEYSILRDVYERSGRDAAIAVIRQRMPYRSLADRVYLLADPSFTVLAGKLREWPPAARETHGWIEFRAPASESADHVAGPLVRGLVEKFLSGDHLLVGQYISELDSLTAQIKKGVIFGVILIFVLAAMASILVTRRTVGRIEQIDATSRAIMASGLNQRIPLRGSRDEWDRVAENLNQMLDRIETLMGEVKQVSDNVAHDLRTPLTRMRGRLEKAYLSARDPDGDRALIGDAIADLDAVLRMFGSIVRIAQIETQARKDVFRTVNLAEIANEVVELYEAAAEQDGTQLSLAGDREVLAICDRDLIFDAIANLVDNALKHGRAGGQVVVASETIAGRPVISIADNGPGIPACEHDHVFKRFYRVEQSRYTPGNGLGLSLVAAVARLHGASIELLDNAPGLVVKLRFAAPGK